MYNISERGRGLGHVTTSKFGIPSTISQKPIKPETSNLVHSFILAPPRKMVYNIRERGRGLAYNFWHILKYISKTGKAREF